MVADTLKYNLDNDDLRVMFENLLISAMTKDKTVHPQFVDLINKMTPNDTLLFRDIAQLYKSWRWRYPQNGGVLFHLLVECDEMNWNMETESPPYEECSIFVPKNIKNDDWQPRFKNDHEMLHFHIEMLEKMGLIKKAPNMSGQILIDITDNKLNLTLTNIREPRKGHFAVTWRNPNIDK